MTLFTSLKVIIYNEITIGAHWIGALYAKLEYKSSFV